MAQKVLDPHMWNLETLFKLIYEVPVYQRPYSWDKEQVEILLNDIAEAYASEDKEEGYYTVRRHIVGGANRTFFSVDLPPRLCRTGTCRRLQTE